MANCNELLKHYNEAIRLSDVKKEILKGVRNSLRTKMEKRFKELKELQAVNHELTFQSQGSFVMDTIITPWDDDFDLDDGVYFLGQLPKEKRPATENFHKWVVFAVGENEDYANVIDKDTCVRVQYKTEKFHIDLPIYYCDSPDNPNLAHKEDGWLLSNPIEFIEWFENKIQSGFQRGFLLETRLYSQFKQWKEDIRKEDAQLRRIVRYLKGWADELRGEMPPGIVMTILAGENYLAHERDDIALRDTLIKIKEYLEKNGGKCLRPTTPINEDLFEHYSDTKKKYFTDRLEAFINSANQAIANPNQKDACLKWQKHFGSRFPCSLAKDEIEEANQYSRPATIGNTAKSA